MVLLGIILLAGPQTKDHLPAIEAALAAGDKPDWWDDAAMGVRAAAWINLVLLGLILAVSPLWLRKLSDADVSLDENTKRTPKWFWPGLLLAVLLAVGMRAPLASKSLWWDESWVVMQVSHGKWRPDAKKPGAMKFQAHDWKRAAWYYQKPTNHAPMSLAQKASLTVWRGISGAERSALNELAARAPALVASALAVLLMGGLLRAWGAPGAGVAAAFLLAVHPWAVRYGVDARGYALVIPMCLSALFAVTRIWQTQGRAAWPWCWFALSELIWLWAYPYGVFNVAVINMVLIVGLLCQRKVWRDRVTLVVRWAAVNLLAAVCLLQVFLPNVVQAKRWAGQETVAQPISLALAKTTLSQIFYGTEYVWPRSPEAAGLYDSFFGDPATPSWNVALLSLPLVAVLLLWLRKTNGTGRSQAGIWILLAAPVVAGVIFIAWTALTNGYFYPRFIIEWMPIWIAALCLLFTGINWGNKINLAWIAALVCAGVLAPLWIRQDALLLQRPYAPLRNYASFMQSKTGAQGSKPLLVCYGHGHEIMSIYAPEMLAAVSQEELEKFWQQAQQQKRPLFVATGHTIFNRGTIPDGFTLLDDPARFKEVAAFAGIEPEFYFRVFEAQLPQNGGTLPAP